MTGPAKPFSVKRALPALGGIAVLVIVAGLVLLRSSAGFRRLVWPQGPGPFHRARYEAVVEGARVLVVKPGETKALRLPDLEDPASLRLRRPGEGEARGTGAGNVWARRAPGGGIEVVIQTRDLGHAGEYGFAYSDAPLSPSPFGGSWLMLDVPSHLQLVLPDMRIDDHWWEVVYNLD